MMEFPPLNAAGVYRQIRIVNALIEEGYKVTVLTLDYNVQKKTSNFKIDHKLMSLVDNRVHIIKIPLKQKTFKKSKLSNYIDNWINIFGDDYFNQISSETLVVIDNFIENMSVDLLVVSAPPFSMLKLSRKLKVKYNIPLLVDMRDAFLGWTMVPFPTFDYFIRRKTAERNIFQTADVITSVTEELINRFMKDHPKIDQSKFKLISNSPNKNLILKNKIGFIGLNEKKIINIGYSGQFYYVPRLKFSEKLKSPQRFLQYQRNTDDWKYRSPYFFFKLLSLIIKENTEIKDRIVFHYIGHPEPWLYEMIKEFELTKNIIIHGYLPYAQVLTLEKQFDLLLTTSEKSKYNDHFCLPSKIFNYLESGKPILALSNNGPQSRLVKSVNCGIVIDPELKRDSIDEFVDMLKNGRVFEINLMSFEKYQMKSTNQLFTQIVKDIL